MQELFQLGFTAQDAARSSGPGRAGRKSSGADESAARTESLSFEAVLALAASLAAQPAPSSDTQPKLQQQIGAVLGPQAQPESGTAPLALSSHTRLSREFDTSSLPLIGGEAAVFDTGPAELNPAGDTDPAIRNLLERYAGQAESSSAQERLDEPGMIRSRLMQEFEGQSIEEHQERRIRLPEADALEATAPFDGPGAQPGPIPALSASARPDDAAVAHLAEISAPIADQISGDAVDIPLDFRPVRWQIPVTSDASRAAGDLAPIERPDRWWQDQSAPGTPVSSRQFPEQIEGTRPFWSRRETELSGTAIGETTARIDADGLDVPDLRVVARNDNPTIPSPGRENRPELRLIDFSTAVQNETPSDDLAARLAGSWENTFVHGEDAQLIESAHLHALPQQVIDERVARERQPVDGATAGIEPDVKSDEPEATSPSDSLAPEEAHAGEESNSPVQLEATAKRGQRDSEHGSQTGSAMHDVASQTGADRTSSDSPVTPVPLFDELLATQRSESTVIEREPAVAVRQAALEIASELRHLQRTGGSEISFSLRLHPEHLGQVEIELQRVDNVWKLSIVAANDEARVALAAEISRLEGRFRDSNLTLDSVSVVTRSPDEAITGPSSTERSDAATYRNTGQDSWTGDQNRDQSGWRNNEPARILGFGSRNDGDTAQELTDRHGSPPESGIDIKA